VVSPGSPNLRGRPEFCENPLSPIEALITSMVNSFFDPGLRGNHELLDCPERLLLNMKRASKPMRFEKGSECHRLNEGAEA